MNKTIIGLVAKGGCGKSAVADILVEKYGFTRMSFAAALKTEVADLYGFDEALCYSQEGKLTPVNFFAARPNAPWPWPLKEVTTPTVREILQWYGTDYMRKKDPDHWVHLTNLAIAGTTAERIVLDDMRFPNEHAMINQLGGRVVRILPYHNWEPPEGMDMAHESETALDGCKVDMALAPRFGKPALAKMAMRIALRYECL